MVDNVCMGLDLFVLTYFEAILCFCGTAGFWWWIWRTCYH